MPDAEFLLLGDALWLEFVNTAATGSDRLADPSAFLRWTKAVRVDVMPGRVGFTEVRKFRDQLLGLARAMDAQRLPPPSAIEGINSRLAGLAGREHLVRVGGSWRVQFAPERSPAALEAIAQSVAQILACPTATIRRCANQDCGLFLLDESLNQSRRWCSRSRCGRGTRIERRRNVRLTAAGTEE